MMIEIGTNLTHVLTATAIATAAAIVLREMFRNL